MVKPPKEDLGFWFPWYPERYEVDTLHLTPEQDGLYRRLIDWMMVKARPLPSQPQALAAIARVDLATWERNSPVLMAFFEEHNGAMHQRRAMLVMSELQERGLRRKANALSAAQKRWGKTPNAPSHLMRHPSDPHATSMQGASDTYATPHAAAMPNDALQTQTQTEERNSLSSGGPGAAHKRRTDRELDPLFERFWVSYPSRGRNLSNPKAPARTKFFLKVRQGHDPDRIIRGALAYAQSRRGDEPRFTKQAVTWLNQEEWEQWGQEVQPPGGEGRWETKLAIARERKLWPPEWGPMPGQPGCLAPPELLSPTDGQGWEVYRDGA